MAKFIFTKEKIIVPGEKIGMILQKHTINEVPPAGKELLMLIDVGTGEKRYLWTVGAWDGYEWNCSFDNVGYIVIEWYELPPRKSAVEDYSYMKDFWTGK